jgi:hypothetical protein
MVHKRLVLSTEPLEQKFGNVTFILDNCGKIFVDHAFKLWLMYRQFVSLCQCGILPKKENFPLRPLTLFTL